MQDIRIIGKWVIDYDRRIAYRKLKKGGYILRSAGGDKFFVFALPTRISNVLEALGRTDLLSA